MPVFIEEQAFFIYKDADSFCLGNYMIFDR
jgi:hypothetical protein